MAIYILIVVILSFLCLFRKNKHLLFISFILLLIVGGFRDISVGTDTHNYVDLFKSYDQDHDALEHATEPLFLLLQNIILFIGGGPRTLIFSMTLLSLTSLYFYALKTSSNPHFVVLCYYLLYFYFYSFNTARQFIAIPLVLIAFYYLDIGKKKKFYIYIIIGALFHLTALCGLLGLFLKGGRVKKKYQIIILGLSFVIGMTSIIPSLLVKVFFFLPEYLVSYIVDADARDTGFSISRFMLTVYNIVLLRLLRNKSNRLTILTFGICLLNLFSFQPIVGRIAQYFTSIQISIIPNFKYLLVRKKRRRYYKILEIASYIYMLCLWSYLLIGNIGEVYPYSFSID